MIGEKIPASLHSLHNFPNGTLFLLVGMVGVLERQKPRVQPLILFLTQEFWLTTIFDHGSLGTNNFQTYLPHPSLISSGKDLSNNIELGKNNQDGKNKAFTQEQITNKS